MSVSLDVMHSKPGIYLVTAAGGQIFVEVDETGACHQLNPETFERDGILRPGNWAVPHILGIYGPLARPQK